MNELNSSVSSIGGSKQSKRIPKNTPKHSSSSHPQISKLLNDDPSDVVATMSYFRDHLPVTITPIVHLSMLYALLHDNTTVDRDVVRRRRIFLFPFFFVGCFFFFQNSNSAFIFNCMIFLYFLLLFGGIKKLFYIVGFITV